VYGTPANDVPRADRKSSQNAASATDSSVRMSPAPRSRWLLTTDSP
jgi:hypothetical protein